MRCTPFIINVDESVIDAIVADEKSAIVLQIDDSINRLEEGNWVILKNRRDSTDKIGGRITRIVKTTNTGELELKEKKSVAGIQIEVINYFSRYQELIGCLKNVRHDIKRQRVEMVLSGTINGEIKLYSNDITMEETMGFMKEQVRVTGLVVTRVKKREYIIKELKCQKISNLLHNGGTWIQDLRSY